MHNLTQLPYGALVRLPILVDFVKDAPQADVGAQGLVHAAVTSADTVMER